MEKLGVELPLLLTQIVNFTIMVFVLSKLLYKPILKSLNARKRKIEEVLQLTEKMKLEEEKLVKRKQEMLAEAKEEAKVIIGNAKKDGRLQKEELLIQGKSEVEQLKIRLEKEMQAKSAQMSATVREHTVEIAAEMVKRILPDLMSNENQHQLIYKQLQEIEKLDEK